MIKFLPRREFAEFVAGFKGRLISNLSDEMHYEFAAVTFNNVDLKLSKYHYATYISYHCILLQEMFLVRIFLYMKFYSVSNFVIFA